MNVQGPQVGDGVLSFRVSGKRMNVTYNIEFGKEPGRSDRERRPCPHVFSIRALNGGAIPRDYYQLEIASGEVLLVNNMGGRWEVDS
jgi:hypothetical protein